MRLDSLGARIGKLPMTKTCETLRNRPQRTIFGTTERHVAKSQAYSSYLHCHHLAQHRLLLIDRRHQNQYDSIRYHFVYPFLIQSSIHWIPFNICLIVSTKAKCEQLDSQNKTNKLNKQILWIHNKTISYKSKWIKHTFHTNLQINICNLIYPHQLKVS